MAARPFDADPKVNGVNVAVLANSIGAIEKDASFARFRYRVHNRWLDGGHTRATAKDFFGLGRAQTSRLRPLVADTDLPAALGGGEAAMDPVEHLLVAVAASLTATLVWVATARGVYLDAIDADVAGEIDVSECRSGVTAIQVSVRVDAECPEDEIDALLELAARRSPVVSTLNGRVRIDRIRARERC